MKNGVVELEESETPTYLYTTLLCDGCHLEHRVRIPYAKGIGKIKFTCDESSLVTLMIIDLLGNEKINLINNQKKEKGIYQYIWDGTSYSGGICNPGVYIIILLINENNFSHKIIHY